MSRHSQRANHDDALGSHVEVAKDTRETKANARTLVKGFTDPDLTEIRSESPTLSRLSRQLILQLSAPRGFRMRKGDVKTAFLSGDREEGRRDVHAEPPQEMRDKLQITREQVLKLETAVFGLRNVPRAWWKRVDRDLTETGWVQHQLDQCTFKMLCRNSKEHFNGQRGMSTMSH